MTRSQTRSSFAMRHLPISLTTIILLLCGSGVLSAQGDTAAPRKQDLHGWWMRNAASFDPIPTQWLFHIEADYSFSLQTGNTEGSTHDGRARFFLRKGRTTLSSRGGIRKQKLSFARGVVELEQEYYRVSPALDYDITPWLGMQGGFLWEHDDAAFIESRTISYLGVKTVPYSAERLIISVMPAFGYLHEEAILTGEKRSFWAPYIEEKVMWQPSDRLRLQHEASFMTSLEESETYRWRMANSVEIPVTSFLSVMFNHDMRYNNNPIPSTEEVRQLTGGEGTISKTDNEFSAGLRLQY